jgi:hypothetical protein
MRVLRSTVTSACVPSAAAAHAAFVAFFVLLTLPPPLPLSLHSRITSSYCAAAGMSGPTNCSKGR